MIRKLREIGFIRESGAAFRFLFALYLFIAAATIQLERGGGQTLIHSVPLEITEYRFVGARISRPLEAQSLDRRPALALLSRRAVSRHDADDAAVRLGELGLVTLTADGYTQGDRQDWPAAKHGETTYPELIAAAVGFLRAQPFIFDDGVLVRLDGFDGEELLEFRGALADVSVLWRPDSAPSEAERSALAAQFGENLTILPPDASESEEAALISETFARTGRPLSGEPARNSGALFAGLIALYQLVFFAAFLTLLPVRRKAEPEAPSDDRPPLARIRTAAAAAVPLAYGLVYAWLPRLLNRPRLVSDDIVLIFAAAGVLALAGKRIFIRGPKRPVANPPQPLRDFLPAAIWLTVVPAALSAMTGNAFRAAGIGISPIAVRQLFSLPFYLPVCYRFGRAVQEFGTDLNLKRFRFVPPAALAAILIAVGSRLSGAGLTAPSAAGITAGIAVWIFALRRPEVRNGGREALFLTALYAALALSSGIMIGN